MSIERKEFNVRTELHIEEVIKGDTFNYILEVEDEDGNAVDYSAGSEMVLTIYEEGTNIVVLTAKQSDGEIDISTAGEIAFDVPASKMDIPAKVYEYDIVFTGGGGNISTEFGGEFEIVLGRVV